MVVLFRGHVTAGGSAVTWLDDGDVTGWQVVASLVSCWGCIYCLSWCEWPLERLACTSLLPNLGFGHYPSQWNDLPWWHVLRQEIKQPARVKPPRKLYVRPAASVILQRKLTETLRENLDAANANAEGEWCTFKNSIYTVATDNRALWSAVTETGLMKVIRTSRTSVTCLICSTRNTMHN